MKQDKTKNPVLFHGHLICKLSELPAKVKDCQEQRLAQASKMIEAQQIIC